MLGGIMRIRTRHHLIVAVATVLALGGMGATEQSVAAPTGKVNWSPCFRAEGPFQCATVGVPLDYDQPGGAKISIALVRLPAADPSRRIGSLFLNPGGPGGSGVEFVVGAGPFLFTQEVRDRFDLVGFDPRGIARSTALRCFGTDRQWGPYFTDFAFPMTEDEVQEWVTSDRYLDEACERRGGALIDHMSTANVARDMDRLRQAVGDPKLSYYGVSYGSMLGQTYANMFPDNFRALVIDGVLDPVAWTTGAAGEQHLPFATRLRSDQGATDTLEEFFRLCDEGGPACPLPVVPARRLGTPHSPMPSRPPRSRSPTHRPASPSSTTTRSSSATPSTRCTTRSRGPTSRTSWASSKPRRARPRSATRSPTSGGQVPSRGRRANCRAPPPAT